MQTYDHIVIGAGSAGCAAAARLSEDPNRSVLLVEAGGPAWTITHRAPAAYIDQFKGRYDWDYMTEPEPGLGGRSIYEPRAKAIGGCSAMNAMIWIRGNPADYDGWGVDGWGWDDVRPVFERLEQRHTPIAGAGGTGPVHITRRSRPDELSDAFIAAASAATGAELGGDVSGHGFAAAPTQMTVYRGRRWDAAQAFLKPARRRGNLTVLSRALVRRIVIRDGRAVGIEWERLGRRGAAGARGDIILSAGAFNTPHLLQLSGIGDPDHLRGIGIEPIVQSQCVGQQLAEHPMTLAVWELRAGAPIGMFDVRHPKHIVPWALRGEGLLAHTPVHAVAHLATRPDLTDPDLQLAFLPLYAWFQAPGVPATHDRPAAGIAQAYFSPASRGTVLARSADPRQKAAVTLNLLTERSDLEGLMRAMRITRQIAATEPFASLLERELHPGPEVDDDASLERWIRRHCEHQYHPVGTARIGSPQDGVVDARLRVHGARGLRVADTSVMPRIIRANTNAAAMMIGERCAEFVLGGERAPAAPAAAAV